MDRKQCACGAWLFEANINRRRHIDSKSHQAYLTRKGKEEINELPVSDAVPISKFTKINAFTDVLPKDLAELCLSYEEYPRLNHLDIIAGAMGFWNRAIYKYTMENEDDDLEENPQLEFIALGLMEFSPMDHILELESQICDNIEYTYENECKYIGTIIETTHQLGNKRTKLYDMKPTELDLSELYSDTFEYIYDEYGIKFKKASDLYRFSLICFLAKIPMTNMKKICDPLIYSSINVALRASPFDGFEFGHNYKIPEFMKEILIKEIYGIEDMPKPVQTLRPIYTRDRHIMSDTGSLVYTNFHYKENIKRTVRMRI